MGAGERRGRRRIGGGIGHRRHGFGHRSRFGNRRTFRFTNGNRRPVARIQLKNRNMKIGCGLLFGSFCCCVPGMPLLVIGTSTFSGIQLGFLVVGACLLISAIVIIIAGAILCAVGAGQPSDTPEPAPGVEGDQAQQPQGADGAPTATAATIAEQGQGPGQDQGQQLPPNNTWGGANPAGMTGAPAPPSYNAAVYGAPPGGMPPPPPPGVYNQPNNAPAPRTGPMAYPPPTGQATQGAFNYNQPNNAPPVGPPPTNGNPPPTTQPPPPTQP